MDIVIIIAMVLSLILSGCSLVSFYGNKKRLKLAAEAERSGLFSRRKLTDEEINSIVKLYGGYASKIESKDLYEISGKFGKNSISNNRGVEEINYYIGVHKIIWNDSLDNYLEENNNAEVIFLKDGQAVIFSLNHKFNVQEEEEITSELSCNEEAEGVIDGTGTEFHTTRPISIQEELFLSKEYRVIAVVGVVVGLLFLGLFNATFGLWAGGVVLVGALWLFCAKRYLFSSIIGKNLVSVSGTLTCSITDQNLVKYNIDRFSLIFPEHWRKDLPIDNKVTIEGYPHNEDASMLSVLAMDGKKFIQDEMTRSPIKWPNKYYLLIPAVVVALFIIMGYGDGVEKLANFRQFVEARNVKKEFSSFGDLKKASLVEGQEILLKNANIFPGFELFDGHDEQGIAQRTTFLVERIPEKFDFSEVENRVNVLEKFQKTNMVLAAKLSYLSIVGIASFFNHYEDRLLDCDIQDFNIFSESSSYQSMKRDFRLFENNFGDRYRDINAFIKKSSENYRNQYEAFLSDEIDIIKNKTIAAIDNAIADVEKIEINGQDSDGYIFQKQDLELFNYKKTDEDNYIMARIMAEYDFLNNAPIRDVLKDIKDGVAKFDKPFELRGIVSDIQSDEGGVISLHIEKGATYGSLIDYYGLLLSISACVALFLYGILAARSTGPSVGSDGYVGGSMA
jgi:hypothetical protein